MAISGPRIARSSLVGRPDEVLARCSGGAGAHRHRARIVPARAARVLGGRLSRAGFAHDAERPPLGQGEGKAVHRAYVDLTGAGVLIETRRSLDGDDRQAGSRRPDPWIDDGVQEVDDQVQQRSRRRTPRRARSPSPPAGSGPGWGPARRSAPTPGSPKTVSVITAPPSSEADVEAGRS